MQFYPVACKRVTIFWFGTGVHLIFSNRGHFNTNRGQSSEKQADGQPTYKVPKNYTTTLPSQFSSWLNYLLAKFLDLIKMESWKYST